jgi:hypothetical protein
MAHSSSVELMFNHKTDTDFRRDLAIGVGSTLGIIVLAVGIITALYLSIHSVHAALNQVFTQQLSVQQGLLYIGVPVVAAGIVLKIAFKILRGIHHEKQFDYLDQESNWAHFKVACRTRLMPTRRQAIIGACVLIALAGLAVGGYFLLAKFGILHQTVMPALEHKMHLWQHLAYIGGGAVAATALTLLAIHIIN